MLSNQNTDSPESSGDPALKAYEKWYNEPTKKNLRSVVEKLRPTVEYTLSELDARGDPVLEGQARLYAADAVKNYDPSKGAQLKTHVSNQLRRMNRAARKARDPIRIPERKKLDKNALYRSEVDFFEAKGREPSTAELEDWSGLPVKRIKELRKIPVVVSEGAYNQASEDDPDNPEGGGEDDFGGGAPDLADEAMEYVYRDATPKDQKIFEHMTGYGGQEKLSPKDLSNKLGVSQSQISRRFAKMMSDAQDLENELKKEVNP